jgi:peroxiredoxin
MGTKPSRCDKAPDFELPDDHGDKLSLASFAGKMLVLYF